MSYGLIYTLPFKDIRQKLYTVKVEQEGYTGQAVELKGQPSPFTVNIDEEQFLYTPLRLSTATLHTFGSDYLQSLFSTDYRMNRVTLYDGSTPVWCGYVKPEVYTQDFRHVKFPLDIECYSAMSVLEFLDFKQQGDTRGFISLWDLIKLCVKESGGLYSAIYVPHTYAKTSSEFASWNNPLSEMVVSQQNFFDEDDNAMTLKEVLESVMKLLNWTCVDWKGELYFVDADGNGEYYKYTPDFASYTKVNADTLSVQNIGYSGANHTLDIVGGYNKVVINCSNYSIEEDIPQVDYDGMIFDSQKENSVPGDMNKKVILRLYRTPKDAKSFLYWYSFNKSEKTFTETESSEYIDGNVFCGAHATLTETLTYENGEPTNIEHDYQKEIIIPLGYQTSYDMYNPKASPIYTVEKPIMRMKGGAAAFIGGALSISCEVTVEIFKDMVGGEALGAYDFHFSLRIGNNYYHGKSDGSFIWDNNPAQNPDYPNNLEVDWQDEPMSGSGDLSTFTKTYNLKTSRKLDDGFEGLKGYIIKFPTDRVLYGDMELIFYGAKIEGTKFETFETMTLHNLEIGYKPATENEGTDRIYENVINENYINPLDDIEFKISSYNDDGACYSKVLLGDTYLTSNLYNGITKENVRLEDFLIRRIINHYDATKYLLTLALKKGDIKPFTTLTDSNTAGKKYINVGGEIDYKQDSFTCKLLEHEAGSSN